MSFWNFRIKQYRFWLQNKIKLFLNLTHSKRGYSAHSGLCIFSGDYFFIFKTQIFLKCFIPFAVSITCFPIRFTLSSSHRYRADLALMHNGSLRGWSLWNDYVSQHAKWITGAHLKTFHVDANFLLQKILWMFLNVQLDSSHQELRVQVGFGNSGLHQDIQWDFLSSLQNTQYISNCFSPLSFLSCFLALSLISSN